MQRCRGEGAPALGVKGSEAELRSASDEFNGHCLALTLLGTYLTHAYDGDVRHRKEVSGHLGHELPQGVHARKVMESTKPGSVRVQSCQCSAC